MDSSAKPERAPFASELNVDDAEARKRAAQYIAASRVRRRLAISPLQIALFGGEARAGPILHLSFRSDIDACVAAGPRMSTIHAVGDLEEKQS